MTKLFLEMLAQLSGDFFGRRGRTESGDYPPIFPNQKFREIPADIFFAFFVGVTRF